MRPEDFPGVFAEGWALPRPGPFLDYFRPLIHDQATFTQPMFTSARGPGDIERMFRQGSPAQPHQLSARCKQNTTQNIASSSASHLPDRRLRTSSPAASWARAHVPEILDAIKSAYCDSVIHEKRVTVKM